MHTAASEPCRGDATSVVSHDWGVVSMRLMQFVRSMLGRHVQAPGGLGGQCVDLTNLYLADVVGAQLVRADAAQWAGRAIPGLRWIENTPDNAPEYGCIVVWREYAPHGIGVAGHIAVALVADPNELVSCDQNWPDGAPVSLQLHDYGGVVGWFAPSWP